MSEIVERVARALAKQEGYAYDPLPYDERARAAIEAMRDFDEADFTFTEAEAIRRFIDAALGKVDA
jgi:hypothetical protein